MLTYDPSKRISAAEAYQHKWFQGKDFVNMAPEKMQELVSGLNQLYVVTYYNLVYQ
jgi:serine/threonine protein kinase